MTAREQAYARSGFGSGFYGGSTWTDSHPYTSPQQTWRAPAPAAQRNDFAQRGYPGERTYSGNGASPYGNRAFAETRPEHSGGFHLFGGGHNAEKSYSYGGGHAPKSFGGGKSSSKGHSGGGGHSGGHHGDGHHR
jgi:hypothetical protein